MRLEKIKREKELEAGRLKQQCYDAYKRKLREDLRKKITKEKEELEMLEVKKNFKLK